jgi:signal transduction histidine kinase
MMKKYLNRPYWKAHFSQTILLKMLLPLFFAVIFILLVWQITQVRFSPVEGSILLPNPTLFTDTTGKCRDSIPDSLSYAPVFNESLPVILGMCMERLKLKQDKYTRAVNIPHEWRKDIETFPELTVGKVLYHFEFFFTEKPQGLWAIALPAVSQNVAVFVNNNLLGWSGSFEQPVARNATRPQMFFIPDGELGKGVNEFDIYVVSQPAHQGFLDEVYIAPAEMLKPAFNDYYLFRHTLPWTIALTIAVLSLFMLLLWVYRRHETEYGLFALGGFFWLLHSLNQLVVDIPTLWNVNLWDSVTYISAGLLGVVGIFFIHRLLDKKHPLLEKTILRGTLVLFILILIVPPSTVSFLLFHLVNILAVIAAFYVFVLTVIHAFKVKSFEWEWYALAAAVGVIAELSLSDYFMMIGLRPLYEGQFLQFGAPFLLLSFMWILLKRFVDTLQSAEKYNFELTALNKNLENRVEARGDKIRQSFETIRVLEQEQVLLKERSRIMRDMHDGIGVYLTSMLRHLENDSIDKQQLSDAAHNALNDLRLMIDSLGSTSTDLPAMLGMFRIRIGVALNACNVALVWHVEELPSVKDFGPERALNLLRILQEAFTNALKHSNADRIRLSAYSELAANNTCLIKIKVDDNGAGFRINKLAGNGLKNMQYRAKKINAELSINTNNKGTRITILLSLLMK